MVTSSNEWKILELDEKLQTNKAIVLSFFRRNIDSQSVYAVLSKSLVSLGIDNTRGNPGNSGQFWALRFSTDLSKILCTACVKYYLLSILNTILFCRLLFIIRIKLIFFFYLCKNYTKLADVVKTDAHEGNSRQHSYLLSKWPEKLVSR